MADVSAPPAPPDDLVELGRIVSAYGIRGWVKVQPHSSQAEVLRSASRWWLASPQSPLQVADSRVAASGVISSPAVGSGGAGSGRTGSGVSDTSPIPHGVVYDVLQVRPQGSSIVAELKGLSDRDDAEALRGQIVSVSRSDFPPASADEYYWVDLIGCQVFGVSAENASQDSDASINATPDDEPVLLGLVHEVGDNGAHAILRVRRQRLLPDGSTQDVLDAKGRPQELLIPFVAAHVSNVDLQARRIDTDWPDAF